MKLKNVCIGIAAGITALICITIAETQTDVKDANTPPAPTVTGRPQEPNQPRPMDPNQRSSEEGRFGRGSRRGGGPGGGFSFDFSTMSPEERQRMMERGQQFARSMGFNGPSMSAPGDPNEATESLNLNNVEMRNIIKMLGDWTGKAIIPSSDEIMQTKITVYSPQRVTRAQALGLIFMALQSRGVIADQGEQRIILRPILTAKLGAIPTLGVDEPLARVQDKTSMVEKWFQMYNYRPSNLVEMIKPLVGEHGYAMADENTGRVAVIDTVDNLLRIEKIIKELDVPESDQMVEQVFEIEYGNPEEIVSVMEMILSDQARQAARTTGSGTSQPQQGQSTPGRSGGSSARTQTLTSVVIQGTTTPIRLIPVAKQRWIIARANREDMKRIGEWIQKLDLAEIAAPQQTVVPVVYASVDEVVEMINRTLRDMPSVKGKSTVVVEGLEASKQIVIFGDEEGRIMVEKMIAQIDLPSGDYFVERTFKLKHADPDQIKQNIEGLYSQTTTSGRSYSYYDYSSRSRTDPKNEVKVISYPTQKQVTVIASEQNMEKIAKQIEQEWDIPLDIQKDQYRILTLQNSDPVKMAELLNKLFSEEDSSTGSSNLMRMLLGDSTESKQKIVGSLYGLLTFEPVPDTKKLIVISKIPEAYEVIERLVDQLDGQEGGEVPNVVILKYADCESLCDQLNSIFNESGTPTTIPRSAKGLSSYDAENQGAAVSASETSSSSITPWWTRQQRTEDQLPPSNLIGKVRFVPVQRSKAILVMAPVEYVADITKMIESLDQPGMQVMIKAVIVEINLEDNSSLGVMLSSNPQAFGDVGINGARFVNALENIEDFSGANGTQLDTSLDIYALVDFLITKTKGRVLNQPTLWTKDNEEAIFVKGQKVAFIEGDQSDSSNLANTTRTYTYENVGITLRVRPNITPEKAVDMTINLNISEMELLTLINSQYPRKNLDTTTRLIVSDGQSIMLGGILEQKDNKVVNKVPLLSDIPLVGELLFTHTQQNLSNTELLVFVTPYVFDETMRREIPV
ncbi:MAG: secretin N-terminal domain-containing protein, partial [Anaerohalosphaeraceae bacterium]